jgi:hypothetical protein
VTLDTVADRAPSPIARRLEKIATAMDVLAEEGT